MSDTKENIEDAERNLRDVLAYQFGSWDDAGPVADAIGWLIEAKIAAALKSQAKENEKADWYGPGDRLP